jgi:hypothetical protein
MVLHGSENGQPRKKLAHLAMKRKSDSGVRNTNGAQDNLQLVQGRVDKGQA